MTADYATFIKKLFPDSHPVTAEVYSTLLNAIGYAIDKLDPYQIGLNLDFSVTKAVSDALDSHGADWAVSRRSGEDDNTYRARILAMLPIYANGASNYGLAAVVKNFIGTSPTVCDLSSDGFSCSDSALSDNALSDFAGLFTVVIYVLNPDGVSYNHFDLEYSLKRGKPARSRVILYHNGKDTSTLNESSTAIVTLVN